MNGYADRSALMPGGFIYEFKKSAGMKPRLPAKEVAGVEFGHFKDGRTSRVVTWAEVMALRREKQARQLENRRWPGNNMRAVRVLVWLNQCFPYEGWHTRIEGCLGSEVGEWLRLRGERNPLGICSLFPSHRPGRAFAGASDGVRSVDAVVCRPISRA